MKDAHNHLLYDIDDGCKSYNQSKALLKNMEKEGITEVIVTPHYMIDSEYEADNKTKKDIIDRLQKETNIKIYMGNEVYAGNNILEYIKSGKISTINNSRYLLMELPLFSNLDSIDNIIFDLRNNGIIPIIAHPERYSYCKIEFFEKLINMGCLFQGNITSLGKKYGPHPYNNLKFLLKRNMIHVLGSDTHGTKEIGLEKCLKKLRKIVDEDIYDDLVNNNFEKIVNNKVLIAYEMKKCRGKIK